jgi:hypothetical protein
MHDTWTYFLGITYESLASVSTPPPSRGSRQVPSSKKTISCFKVADTKYRYPLLQKSFQQLHRIVGVSFQEGDREKDHYISIPHASPNRPFGFQRNFGGVTFLSRNVGEYGLSSYSQEAYSSRIHITRKLVYTKPQHVGRRRIHLKLCCWRIENTGKSG